jgi:hypothetical protein
MNRSQSAIGRLAARRHLILASLSFAALVLQAAACTQRPLPPDAPVASTAGPDDERLRSLHLTRVVPWQVEEACAEAERLSTADVLCPTLIPAVPIGTEKGASYGSIIAEPEPRVYMLNFDKDFFGRPRNCGEPTAVGNCPGIKHWIVGAGPTALVEKWVLSDFSHEVSGDAELVLELTRAGWPVSIYQFPRYPAGGVNGSHTGAFIEVGDEMVFATVHGRQYLHIEAAIEMARELADRAAQGSD